jgi:hypothetical protein
MREAEFETKALCFVDSYDTVHTDLMEFIRQYAIDNEFFTGGDLLEEYRKRQLPGYMLNWRNRWGQRVLEGARRGWYRKAGKVTPKSRQSHTDKLVLWQSRIYKGTQSLTGSTIADQIDAIRKKFIYRDIDIVQALWMAYELGEQP